VGVLLLSTTASADPGGTAIGPNGGVAPYVLPVADGVSTTSLLTVNSATASNGFRMVGIPDGLGAFRDGRDATVYMNHEIGATRTTPPVVQGIPRAHGQRGAFVSELEIDRRTLEVEAGKDLINGEGNTPIQYYDYPAGRFAAAPVAPAGAAPFTHGPELLRFCSGYLVPEGDLYNKKTGYGYEGSLWMANEEAGDESRLFGVEANGQAWQLPRTGLFSWENTIVVPTKNDTTLLIGLEDGPLDGSQLWVYIGTKQDFGNPVERAGLTNGSVYVVDTIDEAVSNDAQFRAAFGKDNPVRVSFGGGEFIDWSKNGVIQNTEAKAKGLSLARIEDGTFNPDDPDEFYFLTTGGGDTTPNPDEPTIARNGGGLWKLTFDDASRPRLGASLELVLNGTEAPFLSAPDNMTIDDDGNLLIQEDPGGSDHVARIVSYRISDGALGLVAEFDRALFGVTNPAGTTPDTRAVLTTDEESSGIIPTDKLFGRDTFLFDAQVHTAKNLPLGTGPGTVEEYVENGQLLLLEVDDWDAVYASDEDY